MKILSTLARYLGLYILFFIAITALVKPSLQPAAYTITGIAILCTLASSLVGFFFTGNSDSTELAGSFFRKTMWKIILSVTGLAIIWSQLIASLFGV